ncbi:ABC transporter substrate-binding protein [Occultella gossypii]|uniref:ABC transporter substrate-binding protein n=1 Tax=Occultella gossypii TaxID=2800820 RepID=A0ABS7S5V1_9MICO|nr:ABC transporter substrate-binding protein [Occultella gossypii]MBZ2195462.1 ABC transporter substrate-binding protein [Occultella gossypii]
MSRTTRATGAAVVALALAVGTAACGDGGGSTDGPVTLTFWHGLTGPDGPAFQQVVDEFNDSQDEITIETEVLPWDSLYQQFLTAATSDDGPDIVAMSGSRLAQYAEQGVLAPTDDFYADTTYMDTSVLADGAVQASMYDGVNYGVPLNLGPVLLYWNKALFAEAGLDPEAPPTTWEEFEGMLPALTVDENGDGSPEQYPLAVGDHSTVPVFPTFLWNGGGGVVSDDGTSSMLGDPATVDAAQYWVDLVREDRITPVGMSGADADQLFQSQLAALTLNGPWLTTGLTEAGLDYGVTRPFAGPDGDDILGDVVSMTISQRLDEAETDAAFTFFAYWESVESQTTWANETGFPAVRTDMPDGAVTNEWAAIFGAPEILDSVRPYLTGVPSSGEINDDIFTPALQSALNGTGEVADLFPPAGEQVQAILDDAS